MRKKLIAFLLICIMMFCFLGAEVVYANSADASSSVPTSCTGLTYGGTIEATCTSEGYTYCGCEYCSTQPIENRTKGAYVSPLGHSWSAMREDNNSINHKRHCTRPGCGAIDYEDHSSYYCDWYSMDDLFHIRYCSICGHASTAEHNYSFEYVSNEECKGTCLTCGHVVIGPHNKVFGRHHCSQCNCGFLGDPLAPDGEPVTEYSNDYCYFKHGTTCSLRGCGDVLTLDVGEFESLDRVADYKMWPDMHQHKCVDMATLTLSHPPYKDESRTETWDFDFAYAYYTHGDVDTHIMRFDHEWDYERSTFLGRYQSELEVTQANIVQNLPFYHQVWQTLIDVPYEYWPDYFKVAFMRGSINTSTELIQRIGIQTFLVNTSQLYGHVNIGAIRSLDGGDVVLVINRLSYRGDDCSN